MSEVVGFVGQALIYLVVDSIRVNLSYIYNHKSIIESLKVLVYYQKNARYRLRLYTYGAKDLHFLQDLSEIFDNFNLIIYKADELLKRAEEVNQFGWYARIPSRFSLSKQARYITNEIPWKLREAENELNSLYGFANSSGMLSTKEIIDALKDDEIITLGVFGENRARKTSELIKACEVLNEEDVFCELTIILVRPCEDYLSQIQYDLAEMLGLTFEQTANFSDRANLLLRILRHKSRIIIILDNIFEKFDLEKVGIPSKVADCYNYKVVITSQKEHVCLEMGAQETIHIKNFPDVAWGAFTDKNEKWVQNAGAHSIAKLLVDKCGDELNDVEELAMDVKAWIWEMKRSSRPQMQTTQNENRININD